MAAGGQPVFAMVSLIFLDNSVEAFEQSPVYLLNVFTEGQGRITVGKAEIQN